MAQLVVIAALTAFFSTVNAHGVVTQITAGGQQYPGYDPSQAWRQPAPDLAGWSTPQNTDLGPIEPPNYAHPDIICHVGATPGKTHVTVAAGDTVTLKWFSWPESHHGPVIDYLARCDNGDCTTVDKSHLRFRKIAEAGLLDGVNPPGYWAADKLREENASWRVTIPACLAPGGYVLRHEIIALHGAFEKGKAQNYPQCVNLRVTGGGGGGGVGMLEGGVEGTGLYMDTDPGILVGIYNPLPGYVVPGPKIWTCGGGDGEGMGTGMGVGMNGTSTGGNNTSTSGNGMSRNGNSMWTTRRRRMKRSG
ncbi:hypothetical protein XANCAGTX0491_006102 [Xanthoria calcicola]